jgi:hypothetical protein
MAALFEKKIKKKFVKAIRFGFEIGLKEDDLFHFLFFK